MWYSRSSFSIQHHLQSTNLWHHKMHKRFSSPFHFSSFVSQPRQTATGLGGNKTNVCASHCHDAVATYSSSAVEPATCLMCCLLLGPSSLTPLWLVAECSRISTLDTLIETQTSASLGIISSWVWSRIPSLLLCWLRNEWGFGGIFGCACITN